jgi:hypothetical protein
LIQDDVLIRTAEGRDAIGHRGAQERRDRAPARKPVNVYTDLGGSLYQGKLAAAHGYVGVAADARGKRLSHGDMSVRKLLTPGKRTTMSFARTPLVCGELSQGSRLLLLLTVNKNAFAQVSYGTGRDVSDESRSAAFLAAI